MKDLPRCPKCGLVSLSIIKLSKAVNTIKEMDTVLCEVGLCDKQDGYLCQIYCLKKQKKELLTVLQKISDIVTKRLGKDVYKRLGDIGYIAAKAIKKAK